MIAPEPSRPLSLETDREPIFGFLHEASDERRSGTGVLIVGPWGWDEVVTYRSRRDWAADLARLGHPTLRIDLPGAGDSAGSDIDDDLVNAWSGGIRAAASALRELGPRRVAVIGMGLGGLSAARAVHEGASVDDLILWAVPTTGRAWLREMRAFAGLQAMRFSLHGDAEPRLLPDGWLEVGGFVLTAATMAAVGTLDLTAWRLGRLERALLLDRDGMAVDKAARAHLEAEGVSVGVGSGVGWAAMCADIERHRPPLSVFEAVAEFLAAGIDGLPAGIEPSETAKASALRATVARDAHPIRLRHDHVVETPITLRQPSGRTFGILAEQEAATSANLCVIFLNAGAVRRIGPNRMWVDASRRWAARGVPSLRLDIEAIGDADGDSTVFADVNEFYRAGLETQITAAIDVLVERGVARRFILVGLCSGAYWAFQVAVADERVVAAVLVNPRALIWDPHIFTRLAARDARKVLQRASWSRFLRGQIGPRRILELARTVTVRTVDGLRRRAAHGAARRSGHRAETVEGLLAGLDRRGTRTVLAFSDEEPLCGQFEDDGLAVRFGRWPSAAFVRLPGRDHTVRPIVAQAAVQSLIDDAIEAVADHRAVPATGPARDAQPVGQPPSPAP